MNNKTPIGVIVEMEQRRRRERLDQSHGYRYPGYQPTPMREPTDYSWAAPALACLFRGLIVTLMVLAPLFWSIVVLMYLLRNF